MAAQLIFEKFPFSDLQVFTRVVVQVLRSSEYAPVIVYHSLEVGDLLRIFVSHVLLQVKRFRVRPGDSERLYSRVGSAGRI